MEDETKDYARLIAAQNEHARRLKIKAVNHTLSDEYKNKNKSAIAFGACLVGLVAATHFSGIDISQALQLEIQSLSSFEALKEYLEMFTPAMWGTLAATAVSYTKYLRHVKKYKKANQEFYDMMDSEPADYLDIVEQQAKSR